MKKTKRKKILIIERNGSFRESLAELLLLNAYEVFCAENGSSGLKLAREQSPDLIICSRSFPDANCCNVLQALRREESAKMTPFIFLSSKPAGDCHQKMNEEEAVVTIIKPFLMEELMEAIQTCCNSSLTPEFCLS